MANKPFEGLIAEVLRNRRLQLGLRQRDVAEALGVSPDFVSQVEAGDKCFDLERTPQLAAVLQINPSSLAHWTLIERAPQLYRALFPGIEGRRRPL
jgi:transcriptional regulator with XRE-family HTH domain